MFHPTRGGVRGGKDQFTWDQVKSDKDREYYLGHSLMAPVGRWQQGKDIMWYTKDDDKSDAAKKANEEFQRAKDLEEKALMAALGYKVVAKKEKKSDNESDREEYDRREEKSARIKKEKIDHSDDYQVKGPQVGLSNETKELDRILFKLLNKYGRAEIIEALGGEAHSKDKKKKKKSSKKSKKSKSKRKDESSDDSSSSDSDESDHSKSKKKSSSSNKVKNEKKHSKSKRDKSTSASSDEESHHKRRKQPGSSDSD